jgi:hypothetical protein
MQFFDSVSAMEYLKSVNRDTDFWFAPHYKSCQFCLATIKYVIIMPLSKKQKRELLENSQTFESLTIGQLFNLCWWKIFKSKN